MMLLVCHLGDFQKHQYLLLWERPRARKVHMKEVDMMKFKVPGPKP
jgi:hypothetical protein